MMRARSYRDRSKSLLLEILLTKTCPLIPNLLRNAMETARVYSLIRDGFYREALPILQDVLSVSRKVAVRAVNALPPPARPFASHHAAPPPA